MRFRPEQHLRRQVEIRAVRTEGPPEATLTAPRACVIASTAAVGNAIHRNRAKRRLRELFRAHQDRLPRHCDFLLIARAAMHQRPYVELEKIFLHACDQITIATKPVPHV
jgi:ribonuclease P protein component